MTDRPEKEVEPDGPQEGPRSVPETLAEGKRQLARRRFLLGGASAVTVVFTAERAYAAVTASACVAQLTEDFPCIPSNTFWNWIRNHEELGYFIEVNCDFWPFPTPPPPGCSSTTTTLTSSTTQDSGSTTLTADMLRQPTTSQEQIIFDELVRVLGLEE